VKGGDFMKIILLGPPGAGKGTQAEVLTKRLGIETISTGVMLRAAIREGTELGKLAKVFLDQGKLVPDDVIVGIVRDRLSKDDCKDGYILDGFPRTIAQAEALAEQGIEIDKVLSIELDDEKIVERLVGRRECKACGTPYHIVSKPIPDTGKCVCGGEIIQRDDDNEETIRNRLAVYHELTEPIIAYYEAQGKVVSINSSGTVEDTSRSVLKALGL
jgi:adenylate kinase